MQPRRASKPRSTLSSTARTGAGVGVIIRALAAKARVRTTYSISANGAILKPELRVVEIVGGDDGRNVPTTTMMRPFFAPTTMMMGTWLVVALV